MVEGDSLAVRRADHPAALGGSEGEVLRAGLGEEDMDSLVNEVEKLSVSLDVCPALTLTIRRRVVYCLALCTQ